MTPEAAAHLAEARARYAAWVANGAPGRISFDEPEGVNICDAVHPAGLAGLSSRLRQICAWIAVLSPLSGWKIFWYRKAGVTIGKNVYIAPGVLIESEDPRLVTLHDRCTLGVQSIVTAHLFHRGRLKLRRVSIGRGATVGVRSIVAASLGDDAVLGPGSVLLHDAPAGTTLIGVPAVSAIPEH